MQGHRSFYLLYAMTFVFKRLINVDLAPVSAACLIYTSTFIPN